MVLIRRIREADFDAALAIVNEAAEAYRGVIPADRWREPYMPADELENEIADGVVFWVAEEDGGLLGVMGIQDKGEVALVRHAYTALSAQRFHNGPAEGQGIPASEILVDSRETGRNLGCTCR